MQFINLLSILLLSIIRFQCTPLPDSGDDTGPFVPLTNCGTASDLLDVETISLNPDPPLVGQNLYINATGLLKSSVVDGAKLHIVVKYKFVKLLDLTQDLCAIAKDNGLPCPIDPGRHSLIATVPIPGAAPKVNIQKTYLKGNILCASDCF